MQPTSPFSVALLLVTTVVLPATLADSLVRGGRRLFPRSLQRQRAWTLAVGVGGTVGIFLVGVFVPTLAIWEVLQAALVFLGFTLLVLPGPTPTRFRVAAVVCASLVVLGVGELAARWTTRSDPRLVYEKTASLLGQPLRDANCSMLFPDLSLGFGRPQVDGLVESAGQPGRPTVVLHVGDSMLGDHFAPNFVSMLDASDPDDVVHVHAGRPGTGPDFGSRIVTTWGRLLDVDAVVYYAYAGNDVADVGQRFLCCDQGPIFDLNGDEAVLLCDNENWVSELRLRLMLDRPAFLLRVTASHLRLSELALTWYRATRLEAADARYRDNSEAAEERRYRMAAGEVIAAAAALDVPLLVVELPFRTSVEHWLDPAVPLDPGRPLRSWDVVTEAFEALGVDAVDATPSVERAIVEQDPDLWVGQQDGARWDEHYGESGHRRMAEFLRPHVDALLSRR